MEEERSFFQRRAKHTRRPINLKQITQLLARAGMMPTRIVKLQRRAFIHFDPPKEIKEELESLGAENTLTFLEVSENEKPRVSILGEHSMPAAVISAFRDIMSRNPEIEPNVYVRANITEAHENCFRRTIVVDVHVTESKHTAFLAALKKKP